MDFRPLTRNAQAKPIIAAKAKMATLSLPPKLAEEAGLTIGSCSLAIATEGKSSYLQIKMAETGEYKLAKRGQNYVATSAELLPEKPTPEQNKGIETDVHSSTDGLIIQLPKDWKLAKQ